MQGDDIIRIKMHFFHFNSDGLYKETWVANLTDLNQSVSIFHFSTNLAKELRGAWVNKYKELYYGISITLELDFSKPKCF